MAGVTIRVAGPGDVARLCAGLDELARDLGARSAATRAGLTAACFGPSPAAHGLIALAGEETAGLALVSPLFSSFRGLPGVFVNDLWVAGGWRGTGLGRRMLAASAAHGARLWGAGYLRLDVHDGNPGALAFYDRLGLRQTVGEKGLFLDPEGLAALARQAGP